MEADERPSSLETHFGVSLIDGLHTLPAEIVSTVHTLVSHPSALAAVRDDRTLVPSAYHEGVRLHPGVISTQRYAMADCEFDGIEIPKGTLIMMLWLFGNRDPEIYESPGEFRLGRVHRPDTTFGGGAYICPGRNIVKMFCQLALEECTRPGVEITFQSQPEWSTASAIHEPLRAPVVIEVG
jgi:cytochrome P450